MRIKVRRGFINGYGRWIVSDPDGTHGIWFFSWEGALAYANTRARRQAWSRG